MIEIDSNSDYSLKLTIVKYNINENRYIVTPFKTQKSVNKINICSTH